MKYFTAAYIAMLIVIFLLPFYSVENYAIWKNTTSQLGAQHAPNAWIMNVVFAALGSGSIIAGWKFLKNYVFHKAVLIIFGSSLILTAFYQHAPIDTTADYNV
ncbi:MAG: DUF998 domain-containing protein, partial [Sinomicrobium sp.]|nr:DUF998 domain-containing protein [Sinomicrobium sp.]